MIVVDTAVASEKYLIPSNSYIVVICLGFLVHLHQQNKTATHVRNDKKNQGLQVQKYKVSRNHLNKYSDSFFVFMYLSYHIRRTAFLFWLLNMSFGFGQSLLPQYETTSCC